MAMVTPKHMDAANFSKKAILAMQNMQTKYLSMISADKQSIASPIIDDFLFSLCCH